jgi:hypothetical protein
MTAVLEHVPLLKSSKIDRRAAMGERSPHEAQRKCATSGRAAPDCGIPRYARDTFTPGDGGVSSEKASMTRATMFIISALGAALIAAVTAGSARAETGDGSANPGWSARAQAPSKATRPRTRIRVVPRYPYRTYSTDYPVPYEYEYPGPGFVRQCTAWLAPENRPSGPVIVPKMRCWWQPG